MAHPIFSIVLAGIASCLVLDLWQQILKRTVGIPTANWAVVGRWFLRLWLAKSMYQPTIDTAPQQANELRVGWLVHYAVSVGLTVPVMPDGAFYAYADCTQAAQKLGIRPGQPDGTGGSWDFAFELMQRAHLAVAPGRDFGKAAPDKFIRFSTASSMAHLKEAVSRLEAVLG